MLVRWIIHCDVLTESSEGWVCHAVFEFWHDATLGILLCAWISLAVSFDCDVAEPVPTASDFTTHSINGGNWDMLTHRCRYLQASATATLRTFFCLRLQTMFKVCLFLRSLETDLKTNACLSDVINEMLQWEGCRMRCDLSNDILVRVARCRDTQACSEAIGTGSQGVDPLKTPSENTYLSNPLRLRFGRFPSFPRLSFW